jgi:hypothetical protein
MRRCAVCIIRLCKEKKDNLSKHLFEITYVFVWKTEEGLFVIETVKLFVYLSLHLSLLWSGVAHGDTLFLGMRHSFCGFNCMYSNLKSEVWHLNLIWKSFLSRGHTHFMFDLEITVRFFFVGAKNETLGKLSTIKILRSTRSQKIYSLKKNLIFSFFSFFFFHWNFLVETRDIFWSSSGLTTTIKSFNSNFIFRRFCKDFL